MPAHRTAPLHQLLNEVQATAEDHDPLTLGQVMDQIGHQSYASLLLVIGLVMAVPGPADIPGVPTLLGIVVILIAVQMVMRREHLWIPGWMERRKVRRKHVDKMISWLRKPAGWLDRVTKPRYQALLNHGSVTMIAVACIVVAMTTPVLEFIPFSANLAGAAIAAFGLAVMARDGLVAAIAIALSVAMVGLIVYQLAG
ncbi:exopolysaccharide biosynthesis protein [Roseimaritima sediminicola]|uniref:exopolysaccharide biosynthesis protein n=1 Tax=Roseimaritima sediminicola TaxID=2662066 RepID=UPI0012983C1D|nr:exopolysaccharide biosynthesis protein [Roseimaritima sediminicola]